jgi:hypothetical protein
MTELLFDTGLAVWVGFTVWTAAWFLLGLMVAAGMPAPRREDDDDERGPGY